VARGPLPFRRGDPLADPEALIRRVYAYVAYRMGDGPDAEDVTSEAMARAVRYRESYDPSRGPPAAWVVGIARRCIDDAYARPRDATDAPETDTGSDLETETIDRLEVRAAVARLPERDRELIALRYGADLSARQIAEQLEMKTNAVEVALHRALKRLGAVLDEPESGEEERRSRAHLRPS
jgi:RNA polymerase sigma-70 factor (ECF subfamily)